MDKKDIKMIYGLLSVALVGIIMLSVSIISMNNRLTFNANRVNEIYSSMDELVAQIEESHAEMNEVLDELEGMKKQVGKIMDINYDYKKVVGVVAAESRGESMEGQKAVAQTIMERSKEWGMTPEEVVDAPGQYANPIASKHIPKETKEACMAVLINGERVYEEPVKWFNNPSMGRSRTHESKTVAGRIGNHVFYY